MEFTHECSLISRSGSARSKAIMAVGQAREGNFDKARSMLEEANEELLLAHNIEREIITLEARGENFSSGILMIHAQDHLTAAMVSISNAEELILLYERISNLERKVI